MLIIYIATYYKILFQDSYSENKYSKIRILMLGNVSTSSWVTCCQLLVLQ